MRIELYEHQQLAVDQLKNGSILCGGVGSGKSRTSLAYYFFKVCKGKLDDRPTMENPRDLYIITTARKRDSYEWVKEYMPFFLSPDSELSPYHTRVVVDSWNNIQKYCNVCGAFFIFDEQRVVGSGSWVKSFYQITKKNQWILLSATPGDIWSDYIPVFVANGFYKNRTQFLQRHAVFSRFAKYPKIEKYIEVERLIRIREAITVTMNYTKPTEAHHKDVLCDYDQDIYWTVVKNRWNPFEDCPVKDAGESCLLQRKISNSSPFRIETTKKYILEYPKLIIFYNFDFELEILRSICEELEVPVAEWNGHKHMDIPKTENWVYLVQYMAGAEGWNCIETNAILFYSANYSYKMMEQAAGRIDRLNTPFSDLYYIHLYTRAPIDNAIKKCLKEKRDFNEKKFSESQKKHRL